MSIDTKVLDEIEAARDEENAAATAWDAARDAHDGSDPLSLAAPQARFYAAARRLAQLLDLHADALIAAAKRAAEAEARAARAGARIAELAEALRFYANDSNWMHRLESDGPKPPLVLLDRGASARARAALTQEPPPATVEAVTAAMWEDWRPFDAPNFDVLIDDREKVIGEECEIARDLRKRCQAASRAARAAGHTGHTGHTGEKGNG